MSAAEGSERARNGQLVTALFWTGVALAPLAAVLLLLAEGSVLLRAAVVLVVLAVVLIGLSITLRRDGDALRTEAEDLVLEELEAFREDIRGDIGHAVRTAHKSASEKIIALNGTVEALRGQVDVLRGQLERLVPGFQAAPVSEPAHGVAPGPVVRHTETVHVTTRHTEVVDPNEALPGQGGVYGGRSKVPQQRRPERGPADSPRPEPQRAGAEAQFSRHEHQGSYDPPRQRQPVEPQRPAPHQPWGDDRRWAEKQFADYPTPGGGQVASVRAGDRWAEVRRDDRGQELHLGERSAAIRSDRSGTEFRVDDRWASVRHEDQRKSPGPVRSGADVGDWSGDRGRRREEPVERAWEAEERTGSAWRDPEPSGRSWHREEPTGNAWRGEEPTGNAWHREEPTGNAWHREEPTGRDWQPSSSAGNPRSLPSAEGRTDRWSDQGEWTSGWTEGAQPSRSQQSRHGGFDRADDRWR